MRKPVWLSVLLAAALATAAVPARAQPVYPFNLPQQPVYPYNLPQLGVIEQAAFTLLDRFFEPVDVPSFFSAAVAAANDELARQGVTDVTVTTPTFTGNPPRDWEQFAGAYAAAALATTSVQIDQQALAYAVIRSMTRALNDCHTFFVPAATSAQQRAQVQGEIQGQGIGIAVQFGDDGYPIVEEAYRGAPAQLAGVQVGDRIVAIDSQDIRGKTLADLIPLFREPVGQAINLTVSRASLLTPLTISVTRGYFTPPLLDTRMLDDTTGYIRIYGFSQRLDARAVQQAYTDLAGQGATAFVLDLRGNPGGAGDAAITLLSALIPQNQLLFSNVSRNGMMVPMFSIDNRWPTKPPLALLINKRTTSAGEVVAAVAQDFGVARLFGTTTRGCLASVEVQPLFDGSAVGITTARVVTAKGRSLNRIGVSPDVEVDRSLDQLAHGADPQLARALQWLKSGE